MENKKECAMDKDPGMLQKVKDFLQAFSEFLRRPKTLFDIKERVRLLILLILITALLEWGICLLEQK